MVALVATIHDFLGSAEPATAGKVVDGRHKADHDGGVKRATLAKDRVPKRGPRV
jgi:hypothetical protein